MKFNFIFNSIIFLFLTTANAQNLVNNPAFESYTNYLDSNNILIYHPESWYYNVKGPNHPYYFSTDRYKNKSFSWNIHPDSSLIRRGYQVNYISIVIMPNVQRAYTELKGQLKKGNKYQIKVDVRPSIQSNCLSDILVGFKDCLNCCMDSFLYQVKLNIPDSINIDSLYNKWITLKTNFIAKGVEKVLVISAGTSKDYYQMVYSDLNKYMLNYEEKPRLKYYIDNVYLAEDEMNFINTHFVDKIDSIEIGESVILRNIYFDFDKYELLTSSFPLLNDIYNYLNQHRNIRVQISGHTDYIGTNEYNNDLSYKRALSVVEYLSKMGISSDRILPVGYGSKFPIDSSNTEEAHQKNRRIEIKIIEK